MTNPSPQRRGTAAEILFGAVKPSLLPLLLAAIWCCLLLVLWQRGMRNEERHTTALALLQARTLCAQMLDTRAWNAAHGGVYVRESAYGAANPWIPEAIRRVTLADGARMVLINPAYMSRQIAERGSARGARLHITSNTPLGPAGRADAWEEAALRGINLGQNEVFKLDASESGQQQFRYLAPLRTEADCLGCHAGSKLHEVRGGISVTLEAAPFLQTMREHNASIGYTYALTGLAGLLGIGSLSFAINRKRLLAEHKERMNSAFLANMSHDMRTPLTGIMGMADLLPQEGDEEKKRRACGYLRSAAAALLDMVTDITTHAVLDAGQLQCVPRPFALGETLERCLELFRPACAEKGLRLELAIADDPPPVLLGDAFRIRQALGNLVGNAVKFTEQGFVRVEAEGERLDANAYMLRLHVRDSGPGIAPEEQPRIFERFAQGGLGQGTPGTGLGLAITRELAALMHGTLTLDSTPGEGSRFTLGLRCALPDAERAPAPEHANGIGPRPSATDAPGALRIVLAEDNRASAYFLQESLRRAGHSVTAAGNGFEALELLRSGPADLAILDIRMPGMNGLQLVEEIRAGGAGVDPALPIISITASQNDDIRARLRQLGVRVQAEKPLDGARLLQLVNECLGGGASACRDTSSDLHVSAAAGSRSRLASEMLRISLRHPCREDVMDQSASAPVAGGAPASSGGKPQHSLKPDKDAALELQDEYSPILDGKSPVPVFDQAAALRLVDGDHALLRKLAAVLLEELPSQELALAQAMERDAPERIRCLAHALKNSAAMLQLRRVRTAAAALEDAAARQDRQAAWQALREALPAACDALRTYVG